MFCILDFPLWEVALHESCAAWQNPCGEAQNLELALEEALEKSRWADLRGTVFAFAQLSVFADSTVTQPFRCTSVTLSKSFTTSARHTWPWIRRVTYVHISLRFPPVLSGPPGSWPRDQRCWLWPKLSGWPVVPGVPHPLPAATPACVSVPYWGPTGPPGTWKQMFWISKWLSFPFPFFL